MYAIRRNADGKFVAIPGHEHSYTDNPDLIWFFQTEQEAKRELCHLNESIVKFSFYVPKRKVS